MIGVSRLIFGYSLCCPNKSSIHSFIHSSIHSFVHSFIHSSILSFTCAIDNVALNKTAYQSSGYPGISQSPSWGTDGNRCPLTNLTSSYCNNSPPSCFKTNFESSPWWYVDLQSVYEVSAIQIWNAASSGESVSQLKIFSSDIYEIMYNVIFSQNFYFVKSFL